MSSLKKLASEKRDQILKANFGKIIPSARTLSILSRYSYGDSVVGNKVLNEESNGERFLFTINNQIQRGDLTIIVAVTESIFPPRGVIALAGTKQSPKKPLDLSKIQWPMLLPTAEKEVLQIISDNPQIDYYVCGHYVGGVLAQYIAKCFRLGGASFNSIGLFDKTVIGYAKNNDFYDTQHPRFYNHIVLKRQENYFLNHHTHTQFYSEYFGNVKEHWPFNSCGVREDSEDPFIPVDQEFLLNIDNFIEYHFATENQQVTSLARRNFTNDGHICSHEYCYYSEQEKESEQWYFDHRVFFEITKDIFIGIISAIGIFTVVERAINYFSPEDQPAPIAQPVRPARPTQPEETRRAQARPPRVLIQQLRRPARLDDFNCVICLSSENEDQAFELPCSHIYHFACINEWYGRNPSCPICRQ